MADLNKVFLIGRLTRDPELRTTPGGSSVTDLGLATNRPYTTKDGERREEVVFLEVTVWNRQAENCCQYLKKGRMVHVEGHLKLDSWEDAATGQKRSKLRVEADRVQFLDRQGGESAAVDDPYGSSSVGGGGEPRYTPAPRAEPRPAPPSGGAARSGGYPSQNAGARRPVAPPPPPPDDGGEEEDIPF